MKKFVKKVSLISLATIGAISVASCGKNGDDHYVVEHLDVDNGDVSVHDASNATRYSYSNASYEERTKILGVLEKYAVNNNLTGLTLYGDGSYVGYSTRIQSPNNWTYIPGYGFGIVSEGSITEDLASETNTNWKRYYHSYETDVPPTLNYMNSQESVTGDLAAYVQGSYFGTKIDETDSKAYRWMGDLAVDNSKGFDGLLEAVDANEEGMAYEYKFKLKSDIKYTILSSNSTLSAFNNTTIAADDYLTPYKLYYSQYVAFVRGTETFGTSQEVAGASDYYKATQKATTWEEMDAAWEKYMSKSIYVDSEGYLHYKFKNLHTKFYAMYESSSFMFAPVPKSYISALQTVGSYDSAADAAKGAWMNATDNTHGSLTPVDTVLSSGAYAVESWTDTAIVFKRSNRTDFDGSMYNIQGIHFAILTAQKTDTTAAYKAFLGGTSDYDASKSTLDAAGVPSTMLNEQKSKAYVKQSQDSSTYKINYNTCTKERWAELFGTNGTITQTAEASYWDVKPCMSNNDFLKGLSLSLDRSKFAETYGRTATANYFGNGYYSNPENGTIYNTTDEHKAAMSDLVNANTDKYGYSLALAQDYFTKAAKTLTESGAYKSGDTVKIEVAWQTEAQSTTQGATLKQMFESAFNQSGAHTEYGLTLEVTNYACAVWSDVYYKKMMVGQFDLAFGSISGNSLNPLNFLEVLKSDNSSGFTLNWGPDTNTVDETISYDGKTWSFDALWQAADSSALVENGKKVDYVDTKVQSSKYNEDGSRTTRIKYSSYTGSEWRATFLDDNGKVKDGYVSISLYDVDGNDIAITAEDYTVTVENGYIVVTTNANIEIDSCLMSVQVYYDVEQKIDGEWTTSESAKSDAVVNAMTIATGK